MRNCWTKAGSFFLILILLLSMTVAVHADETPDIYINSYAGIQTLQAGTETDLKIPIENTSTIALDSVVVSPVIDDINKFPFEVKSLSTASMKIHMNPKESRTLYLPVKVLKTAEPKTYSMGLTFDYKTDEGMKGTITKTIYFRVANSNALPKIDIRKTDVSNGYIAAGGQGRVAFEVVNNGDVDMKDVKVSFKDLTGADLLPLGGDQTESVPVLQSKHSFMAKFDLKADDKVETKSYLHTLEITYKDEYDKSYTIEKKVYIPTRKGSDQAVDMALENVQVPGGIRAGKDFTISFNVSNRSQIQLSNLAVKLETDAGLLAKSAPVQQVRSLGAGKSQGVQFRLYSKGDLESKTYPVKAIVTYEVGNSTDQKTYYEYLTVDIDNASGKTTPKLIVSNFSYGDVPVLAGKAFPLKISFANTNQAKPIYNIKITLVPAENIFTPVGTSNSFYISQIGAGQEVNRGVSLRPDYSAKPKNYPVEVKMDYEDETGKAFSMSDTISIAVKQDLVPRISKLEVAPTATLNTPNPVTLSIFNIGKAEIRNIFVSIQGDNLKDDQGEMYLGNLGEGSDTAFDGTFTPGAVGEQKGVIVIKYQDESGEIFEMKQDFKVTVQDAPPVDPNAMQEGAPPQPEGGGWIKYLKIGGGIAVLAAAAVFGFRFWKRRKDRKQVDGQ